MHERDTRSFKLNSLFILLAALISASSNGCPGPETLYKPNINEVNSCPPGIPWKATWVLVFGLINFTNGKCSPPVFWVVVITLW